MASDKTIATEFAKFKLLALATIGILIVFSKFFLQKQG